MLCLSANLTAVTEPPVQVSISVGRPEGLATVAQDAGNTHVLAVSLSVSAALLICLVIIVRTQLNFIVKCSHHLDCLEFITLAAT